MEAARRGVLIHRLLERLPELPVAERKAAAEAWLAKMDENKAEIMPLFRETYGADQAVKWWAYWRIFYLACAELWGYRGGEEWIVSHYRFVKPA